MNSIYGDNQIGFWFDQNWTNILGVTSSTAGVSALYFTNLFATSDSYKNSLLLPSGTAGITIWANNTAPYSHAMNDPFAIMLNQWYFHYYNNSSLVNPGFVQNWVNISNDPDISWGASAAYINSTYRFLQLGFSGGVGNTIANRISLTSTSTGNPFCYLWQSSSYGGM